MVAWIIILGLVASVGGRCSLHWKHDSHQTMMLECQVPEWLPCVSVELLDDKGRPMNKLFGDAATADPSRNDRCLLHYRTTNRFVHQYLAVVADEVIGVDAPLEVPTGSNISELQFFIVNGATPEVMQHIHEMDPEARIAEVNNLSAALVLKGINNSSVYHDKLHITYNNSTLQLNEHYVYKIHGGDSLQVNASEIQIPEQGYLRITFDGLLTYYEQGFSYDFRAKCKCDANVQLINGRLGWMRGYCSASKLRNNGFSLVECPEDKSHQQASSLMIGITSNNFTVNKWATLHRYHSDVRVLYLVQRTPLRIEDTILVSIFYPVRVLMVVLTYSDPYLAGILLTRTQRAEHVIEHVYVGRIRIAYSNIGLYTYRPYLAEQTFSYDKQRVVIRIGSLQELSLLNTTDKIVDEAATSGGYDKVLRAYILSDSNGLTLICSARYQPYTIQHFNISSFETSTIEGVKILRNVGAFEFAFKFLWHPTSVLEYFALALVAVQLLFILTMWIRIRRTVKGILAHKRKQLEQPYMTIDPAASTRTELVEPEEASRAAYHEP